MIKRIRKGLTGYLEPRRTYKGEMLMVKKIAKVAMWTVIGCATLAAGAFAIAYISDTPDWHPGETYYD